MSQKDTITYLADLFHISPSALRYWDNEGLIRFERSPENNYRKPSINTMLDICDVLLFRGLSLPLKQVREIPSMNREQLRFALKQNETRLKQQIEELTISIERMEQKYRMLDRVEDLENHFQKEKITLPAIQEFTFDKKEYLLTYIHDTYDTVILIDPRQSDEPQYGILFPDSKETPMRTADPAPRYYLKGLLKINTEDTASHNYNEFSALAKAEGFQPGILIGRYLITAWEEHRYDYYEAWLELD